MDGQTRNGAKRRGGWVWLGVWLGVGLIARLGAVAIPHLAARFPGAPQFSGRSLAVWADKPFFPDSFEYLGIARSLRAGQGFALDRASRIARMPAYPVFLAAVQALFGERVVAARVADAFLGTLLIALVWLLTRELYGRAEAAVAAAIAALYPFFVVQAVLVLTETLFGVFLVAGALFLAKAWKAPRLRWAGLAGLLFGLATLTQGSMLLAVPLVAAAWVVARRLERRVLVAAGAMLGVLVLVLAPWVARNWAASDGHVVLTTLRVGPSLYEGLNPDADGGPMMGALNWDRPPPGADPRVIPKDLSEYEKHRYWRARALEYAWGNPGRVLVLAAIKLGRFWNVVPNLEQFRGLAPCIVLGVPYAAVMALVGLGLARRPWRGDVALILLLPVVYHCMVHMVFVGSVRYREAVMPLLVAVAAHGAVRLWGWVRPGRRTQMDSDSCESSQ